MAPTYAVFQACGSQHFVHENDVIDLFSMADKKPGDVISFNEVLLICGEKDTFIGQPFINDASVTAEVVDHHQGEKIRVATYKAKSRHRRAIGHRDQLTRVKILSIIQKKQKTK